MQELAATDSIGWNGRRDKRKMQQPCFRLSGPASLREIEFFDTDGVHGTPYTEESVSIL